ncbi:hypothetical protein PAEPH01_0883 [Pancytospora epiphaga]|nr:hypothetical protein PAEPH01_0883 [Pancytospora epiphaga]
MVCLLFYLGLLRGEASVYSTIQDALNAYNEGKFDIAESIFHKAEGMFSDNESFQSDYFDFLIKMGKYEKVLGYSATCKPFNRNYIASAKEYLDILRSGDREKISSLVDVSPNSYDIVVTAAEHFLGKLDYAKFNRCMSKAAQLRPNSPKNSELQGRQRCMIGRYEEGIELLKKAGLGPFAETFTEVVAPFRKLAGSNQQDPSVYSSYERLYSATIMRKSRDPFKPSIYNHIFQGVLGKLLLVGVVNKRQGVYMYADRLLELERTQDVMFLTVKAAVVDGKPLNFVTALFDKYKGHLNESLRRDLKTYILAYEEQINAKRREQEEEQRRKQEQQRREQQRQQQQRQQQTSPSARAGTDFLGYYAALKLNKTAKGNEIKKAHKKAFRIASRVNDDAERDKKLKVINKAHKVLSDDKTRQMYDQGIDPDNPQEFRQQNFYGHNGGNTFVMDEMDLNDIFGSFFGGGQSRGSRFSTMGGGRRAQYFYFG